MTGKVVISSLTVNAMLEGALQVYKDVVLLIVFITKPDQLRLTKNELRMVYV